MKMSSAKLWKEQINKELEKYFHYIIFSQELNYSPSTWNNPKLLSERKIEQLQQQTQLNF